MKRPYKYLVAGLIILAILLGIIFNIQTVLCSIGVHCDEKTTTTTTVTETITKTKCIIVKTKTTQTTTWITTTITKEDS
ncbi:MAG: hypothetical protein LZ173_01235 [Thaumarchaeota archaeon]|jgi:hypothetical protein|nr:hypothetical protein [Candidatus Geocrenenecus arthurdayi]